MDRVAFDVGEVGVEYVSIAENDAICSWWK
jgi:hypothetical protein